MGIRYKPNIPGNIYFITFTIYQWTPIFMTPPYIQLIYKWFDYQKQHYQNKIYGYVIMPNHFHGLIYISHSSPPLDKLIQNAKRFLAYGIISQLKSEDCTETLRIFQNSTTKSRGSHFQVFEPRYDATLLDRETYILQKLAYIHNNPCRGKWMLAESPELYPYSSASNYSKGVGAYPVDLLRLM